MNYDIIHLEVNIMNSPSLEKSLDFATKIVFFYEEFSKLFEESLDSYKQTPTNDSNSTLLKQQIIFAWTISPES